MGGTGGGGQLPPQHEFGGDKIEPITLRDWENGLDKKGQGQSWGHGNGEERRGQRLRSKTQLGALAWLWKGGERSLFGESGTVETPSRLGSQKGEELVG